MVGGVLKVLKEEGFIESFEKSSSEKEKSQFLVVLKYYAKGEPLIKRARRVSTPGCRVYSPVTKLPRVKSGLGICILSTSKGVMGDREARAQGVGGEVIALVS
jgi:small subunit ribosomal protein S8